MSACPRMHALASRRLWRRLPRAKPRLVPSRSAFSLSIAKTPTATGLRSFLALASSARVPLSPRFRMLRSSRRGVTFAAWIGIVSREGSTGGEQRLGPISKQGDRYLRRMLIVGAFAVIKQARAHPEKLRSKRPTIGARLPIGFGP
jgi:hypothetical protein